MTKFSLSLYLNIVYNKFFESIRHKMSCFLVTAIANAWHKILPLEPSPYSVVNTFGLAPAWLKNTKEICYRFVHFIIYRYLLYLSFICHIVMITTRS